MKLKRKHIIFIVIIVILLLIILHIAGVIDLNLYRSNMEASQTASIAYTEKIRSYNIEFIYKGEHIYGHTIIIDNQDPVPITVSIDDYQYTGNYYLPFYKKFTMTYHCIFKDSSDSNKEALLNSIIRGEINGTVTLEIEGVCSARKAKELAEDKAFNSIKEYIINSIMNQKIIE